MGMRAHHLCIFLLFGVLLIVTVSHVASGVPSQVNRTFYLVATGPVSPSVPGVLSSTPTTGPCSSCMTNLTTAPVSFVVQRPLVLPGANIQGPVVMSLSVDYQFNKTAQPSLQAAFSYRLPGASSWTNANSTQLIATGLKNVTFNIPVPSTQLPEGSSIAIEASLNSLPKNATISLLWGPNPTRSLVVIPMSGYAIPVPTNTVAISDTSGNLSPFYLNSFSTILVVKVDIQSAFGLSDIQRVNMTVFDPHSQPVKGATNESMTLTQGEPCPCSFVGSWQYQAGSTQGTYSTLINIVDTQGNIAYSSSPSSSSTFLLVPPGYVPFPYNLIPYLIVGGVSASGGVAGAVVYRRRRGKSYLVPFDHFNTLTGGELSGGTAVTVEGNTGSGKTLLMEQLMGEDLRKGRPCVFISTGDFPDNVRSNMKTMGFDVSGYEQKGLLTFVDGYSSEAGQDSREKIFIPSLGDLTTLGIKLSSAFPPAGFKGGSLYFDSLTPLASKARPESIVSFVQSVSAKVKGLGGKAFFAVGLGTDTTVQRQLEDTMDCIVQMEAFEEAGGRRRRLRIAKFRARKHQEGWSLFTIEDGKGIIFYSKKPTQ